MFSIGIKKPGIQFEEQKKIEVFYGGELVGDLVADLVIADAVIVELKSARTISKAHEVQLVNYPAARQKSVGLLVNFAENEVQIKKKLKDPQPRPIP